MTREELEFHLTLHMAAMGAARVLAFPEVILFRLPECVNASGPHDAMFLPVDPASQQALDDLRRGVSRVREQVE